MMNIRTLLLALALYLCTVQGALAQVDTLFWFAVPDATEGHRDSGQMLRMSSLDQPAVVTVDFPGTPSMRDTSFTLAANSTRTYVMNLLKTFLECSNANGVMNNAVRVRSTAPITAYYELSNTLNTEIWALKGNNGFGREFYTPFQTFWRNDPSYDPDPFSWILIVALYDSTDVTITPTKDMVGHTAGTPFTVRLNKGQVYAGRALGDEGNEHATGTHITATKAIAVQLADDSVQNGGSRDMIGDQLVPVDIMQNLAFTEYIAVAGQLQTGDERIYVVATEDATEIYRNGSMLPLATLNAGQTREITFPSGAASMSLRTTAPVYVFHVSGYEREMGGALIPGIHCTGSKQVSFTRSGFTGENFSLNILVKDGAQDNFTLNGNSSLIDATQFFPVPGTGVAGGIEDLWVAAQLEFDETQIPLGTSAILANSESLFHMGIINGENGVGCRYGYFTSFTRLNLGVDGPMCMGETVTLDAGPDRNSYQWERVVNGTGTPAGTGRYLAVTEPGTYKVTVTEGNACPLEDEITLTPKPNARLLGSTPATCSTSTDGTATLTATDGTLPYRYSANGTDWQSSPTITDLAPGAHTLFVQDADGCTAPVAVSILAPPTLTLAGTTTPATCGYSADGTATSTPGGGTPPYSYSWSSGATTQNLTGQRTGSYTLTLTDAAGCTTQRSFAIGVADPVNVSLAGANLQGCVPFASSMTATGTGDIVQYTWYMGSTPGAGGTADTQVLNWTAADTVDIYVVAETAGGCRDTSNVLTVYAQADPLADFNLILTQPERDTAYNNSFVFENTSIGASRYSWDFGDGRGSTEVSPRHTYSNPGAYCVVLKAETSLGCADTDTLCLTVKTGAYDIPNAFSPNGDGTNDVFEVFLIDLFQEFEMYVYNRWGEELFYTPSQYGPWWDGTYKGKPVPEGVYVYKITTQTLDGTSMTLSGTVTVLR